MFLCIPGQQAARSFESRVVANACEDVQNLALLRPGVLDAIGGNDRKPQCACDLNGLMIDGLLLAVEMPLHFDINAIPPKDFYKPFDRSPAFAGAFITYGFG